MKTAIRRLRAGKVLGIFPEGFLGHGELQEFQEGAAVLAEKTNSKILPVGLVGNRVTFPKGGRLVLFKRVKIHIGKTLDPAAEDLTKNLKNSIEMLISQG